MNERASNRPQMTSEEAEALLSGNAGKSRSELADFLTSVSTKEILVGEELATARIAAALRTEKRFDRSIPAKVAAIAFGAVLSIGGVAAAATGSLPAPAQAFVSSVAAEVGVEVPEDGADEVVDEVTPPTTVPETTTTSSTIAPSTTTTTAVTGALQPSEEACEAARAVEGAKGCSAVAKAHAPGQQKKAETTTTTDDAPKDKDKGKSAEAKAKNEKPNGNSSQDKK